jgi:hypothetical protein
MSDRVLVAHPPISKEVVRADPSLMTVLAQAKVRGRNRTTGNRSVRSRPLAPSQPPPRIAIASDVPRGAATQKSSAASSRDRCSVRARMPIKSRRQLPCSALPASIPHFAQYSAFSAAISMD